MAADGVNLQLTEEERRVLRECRINSLYFRGIPLGAISILLARQAGKSGFLPQFKRFAALYYPGVFTLGLLVGLASYRRTCFEKIMKLDNSRLAEQVREFYNRAGIPYDGPTPKKVYPEQQEVDDNQAQFDTPEFEAPVHATSLRPPRDGASMVAPSLEGSSAHAPSLFHEEDTSKPKYTTYEELRKKNRSRLQSPPPGQRDMVKRTQEESRLHDFHSKVDREEDTIPIKRDAPPKRNKYGDLMD